MPTPVASYSGTPLLKKLGLKEGGLMVLLNAAVGIEQCMQPLPTCTTLVSKMAASNALVALFCKDMSAQKKSLPAVSKKLPADGSLGISWPMKASKLFMDLTEDDICGVVLARGWSTSKSAP